MKNVWAILPIFLVLTLSVGLADNNAFAQTVIEQTSSYDRILEGQNEQGENIYTVQMFPPRIHNESGQFVPYIFTDAGSTLQVNTAHGSITLDKSTCEYSFYNTPTIVGAPQFIDSIIPQIEVTDGIWDDITSIRDAACVATFDSDTDTLIATKQSDEGQMNYKYTILPNAWKTQLEITNLGVSIDNKYGFIQIVDLESDEIVFGGERKIVTGTREDSVFNSQFLRENNASTIGMENGYIFNFDIGFDNLEEVKAFNRGVNKSGLEFHYTRDAVILLPSETLVIDPVIVGDSDSGQFHRDSNNNSFCDTWTTSVTNTSGYVQIHGTADTNDCVITDVQFRLPYTTAVGAVSAVGLDLEIVAGSTNENVDIVEIDNDDLGDRTGAQRFASILAGTEYYDAYPYNTTGLITVPLNSVALADVLSVLQEGITYDVNSLTYDSLSYDVTAQSTSTTGLYFSSDGFKLYHSGDDNDEIYAYTLGTAYDVSSASYDSVALSTIGEGGLNKGFYFSRSGGTLFSVDEGNSAVYQYGLTSPWNLTTASYSSKSLDVSSEDTQPQSIEFRELTAKDLYVLGNSTNAVYQYSLTSAYDLSTATYASKSLDVSSEMSTPSGIIIRDDGITVLVLDTATATIFEYSMATPWDISTATYSSKSFSVTSQDTAPVDLWPSFDGSKLYVMGDTNDTVYQYSFNHLLSIGFRADPATQEAANAFIQFDSSTGTNPPELSFTYTGAPAQVTGLNVTNPTPSTLDLEWLEPDDDGSAITGYQIQRTTPVGGVFSVLLNSTGDTNLTYTNTGIASNTEYDYRVAAWNSIGLGAFSAASSNQTLPNSPTSFVVSPDGTSTSQLLLAWVAPVPPNGVNGYKIEREAPVGGGFATIVANTTDTLIAYTDTGLVINTYYNYRVSALTSIGGESDPSNTYSQTTYHLPDAVDDLVATAAGFGNALLTWTVPDILYGYIQGYMINYTTPAGAPTTIYVNSTGTSDVTAIVGLPINDYSYRVSAVTVHGTNVTGALIANLTTIQQTTLGSLDVDFSQQAEVATVPITFALDTVNNTQSVVQVFYDSAMDLDCNIAYKYARSNTTYSGLTENTISGSSVYHNFTLTNPSNEIIDINCVDSIVVNNTGFFQVAEGDIPFFTQAENFQGGLYGTEGLFGFFDLLTLLVVIISMIGFNRYNPAVGVVLMISMLGALAFYGLIELSGLILGVLALFVVLAIGTVKKS